MGYTREMTSLVMKQDAMHNVGVEIALGLLRRTQKENLRSLQEENESTRAMCSSEVPGGVSTMRTSTSDQSTAVTICLIMATDYVRWWGREEAKLAGLLWPPPDDGVIGTRQQICHGDRADVFLNSGNPHGNPPEGPLRDRASLGPK